MNVNAIVYLSSVTVLFFLFVSVLCIVTLVLPFY